MKSIKAISALVLFLVSVQFVHSQDVLEPNDSFGAAYDITSELATGGGVFNRHNLTITASNDDYYKLVVSERSELTVSFYFFPGNGNHDLDAILYNSSYTQILIGESGNPNEILQVDDLAAGTYYIKLFGWGGATNTYSMNVKRITYDPDDAYESNDTKGTAYNLNTLLTNSNGQLDVNNLDIVADNEDWFKFTTSATSDVNIDLWFTHSNGDINAWLYDASDTLIQSATSTSNNESLSSTNLSAGEYFVKITGAATSDANHYAMSVEVSSFIFDDNYEENDTKSTAKNLTSSFSNGVCYKSNLRLNSNDEDWFKVVLTEPGTISVVVVFAPGGGNKDLDSALIASNNTVLDEGTSNTPNEVMESGSVSAGTYYIKVYGYDGADNNYDLEIIVEGGLDNEVPTANGKSVTLAEDSSSNITLTGTDPENDTLSFVILTQPSHGTLSGTGAQYLYTPYANYNGNDSFTFNVNDGSLSSAAATVNLTINPVNDAPTANFTLVASIKEVDNYFTVDAVDIDGDSLTYTILTTPEHGTITATGTPGMYFYTPAVGDFNDDSVTYRVNDGLLDSSTGTISFTINDRFETNNTSGTAYDLTTLISDAYGHFAEENLVILSGDEDWYKITLTERSELDLLCLFSPGNGSYDLELFVYNSSLTEIASAESGNDNEIINIGDIAAGTYYIKVMGWSGSANDYDLQIEQRAYSPDDVYEENDSKESAYNLTSKLIAANGQLLITDLNILSDDPDWYKITTVATSSNLNFSIDFTHSSGDLNIELFDDDSNLLESSTSTTNDESLSASNLTAGNYFLKITGAATSDENTYDLSLEVDSYIFDDEFEDNDTKGASSDISSLLLNNEINISDLKLNTYDEDWFKFTTTSTSDVEVILVFSPGSGLSDIDGSIEKADGTLIDEGVSNTDNEVMNGTSLPAGTYYLRVYGWSSAHNSYDIQINFSNQGNSQPVSYGQSVSVTEDIAKSITLSATDSDNDTLTYSIQTSPTHGALSGTGASLTYTPNANYFGSDSFTFYVNDGLVNSNISTVTLAISAVNDAPVANDDTSSAFSNAQKDIDVLANDTDVENNTLSITSVSSAANGSASVVNNKIRYTSNLSFEGTESLNYYISDGNGGTASATLVITVSDPGVLTPSVINVSVLDVQPVYELGEEVAILVEFDGTVNVTGSPILELETGAVDRNAIYDSKYSQYVLKFIYTVQSGDTSEDLAYKATTSLALNSGTIKGATGNNATLTLANPGSSNSLSYNENIRIVSEILLEVNYSGGTYNFAKTLEFKSYNLNPSLTKYYYTLNSGTPDTSSSFVDNSDPTLFIDATSTVLKVFASDGTNQTSMLTETYEFEEIQITRIPQSLDEIDTVNYEYYPDLLGEAVVEIYGDENGNDIYDLNPHQTRLSLVTLKFINVFEDFVMDGSVSGNTILSGYEMSADGGSDILVNVDVSGIEGNNNIGFATSNEDEIGSFALEITRKYTDFSEVGCEATGHADVAYNVTSYYSDHYPPIGFGDVDLTDGAETRVDFAEYHISGTVINTTAAATKAYSCVVYNGTYGPESYVTEFGFSEGVGEIPEAGGTEYGGFDAFQVVVLDQYGNSSVCLSVDNAKYFSHNFKGFEPEDPFVLDIYEEEDIIYGSMINTKYGDPCTAIASSEDTIEENASSFYHITAAATTTTLVSSNTIYYVPSGSVSPVLDDLRYGLEYNNGIIAVSGGRDDWFDDETIVSENGDTDFTLPGVAYRALAECDVTKFINEIHVKKTSLEYSSLCVECGYTFKASVTPGSVQEIGYIDGTGQSIDWTEEYGTVSASITFPEGAVVDPESIPVGWSWSDGKLTHPPADASINLSGLKFFSYPSTDKDSIISVVVTAVGPDGTYVKTNETKYKSGEDCPCNDNEPGIGLKGSSGQARPDNSTTGGGNDVDADSSDYVVDSVKDEYGRVTWLLDRNGGVTTYVYDDANKTVTETSPTGAVVKNYYESDFKTVFKKEVPYSNKEYLYEYSGSKISSIVTKVDGNVFSEETYEYDSSGNITNHTKANGTEIGKDYEYSGADITKVTETDEFGNQRIIENILIKNQIDSPVEGSSYFPYKRTASNGEVVEYEYLSNYKLLSDSSVVHKSRVKVDIFAGSLNESYSSDANYVIISNLVNEFDGDYDFDDSKKVYVRIDGANEYWVNVSDTTKTFGLYKNGQKYFHETGTFEEGAPKYYALDTSYIGQSMLFDYDGTIVLFSTVETEFISTNKSKVIYSIPTETVPTLSYTEEFEYLSNGMVRTITKRDKDDVLLMRDTYDSHGNNTKMEVNVEDSTVTSNYAYTYFPSGNVETITMPDGGLTTYTYNSEATSALLVNLVSKVETDHSSVYYEYDLAGRITKTYGDTSNPGLTTYNTKGYVATFTAVQFDPVSETFGDTKYVEEYTYTGPNLTSKVVRTADSSSSIENEWTYDEHRRVSTQTDPNGTVTKYEYNNMGQTILETMDFSEGSSSLNIITTYSYNTDGQLYRTNRSGIITQNNYDTEGRLESVVLDPDGLNITQVEYEYDLQFRQSAMIDANGNRTEYRYDLLGRQHEVENALGVVSRTEFDGADRTIRTISDYGTGTENITVEYEYDTNGRQVQVTSAVGTALERVDIYEYDKSGRMTRQVEDDGGFERETEYEYNSLGYQTKQTLDGTGLNLSSESEYNEFGELISSTAPNGLVTEYEYDFLGRQIKTTVDPTGEDIETTTEYDDNGNTVARVDAEGLRVEFEYDAINRQTKQTVDPSGEDIISETVYNSNSTVYQMINPEGTVTQFGYDAIGRRTSVTVDPTGLNLISTYTLDNIGNTLTVVDALTKSATMGYDVLNRAIATTDAKGNITRIEYDSLGRRSKVIDAEGVESTFTYDALSRTTSQTSDPTGLNLTTSYLYDKLNRVTKVTKPNGIETVNQYDLADRQTVTTMDPSSKNVSVAYDYNALGQVVQISDGESKTTDYTYDLLGRLIQEDFADSGEKYYEYNKIGQRNYLMDQNGNEFDYTFDDVHRLTNVAITKGSGIIGTSGQTFEYDIMSRVTKAVDGSAETTRVYDDLGRLTSEAQKLGSLVKAVDYEYNGVGRMTKLSYPGGREVDFTYDNNHLPNQIMTGGGTVAVYTYNAVNAPITKTLGNGVVLTTEYDNKYRVTKHEWKYSSTTLTGYSYGYDSVGNRLYSEDLVTPSKSEHFTFDNLDRLTNFDEGTLNGGKTAITSPTFNQNWTLDKVGNWSNFTDNGSSSTNTFTNTHEMTAFKGQTITYDDNGNLSDDGPLSYEYDAFNRIVKVSNITGVLVEYVYDAFNRRVRKTVDTNADGTPDTKTTYTYSGFRVVEELDDSDALAMEYVHGQMYIDEIILQDDQTTIYYFAHDRRYSTTALMNTSGSVVETYDYKVYGKRVASGSGLTEMGYTGRRHDSETGLMYFRNRYYSVDRGSFVTRDPLGYVDGTSMYLGYFGAMRRDPRGLRGFTDEEVAFGVKLYAEAVKLGKEAEKSMEGAEGAVDYGKAVEFEMKKAVDDLANEIKALKNELPKDDPEQIKAALYAVKQFIDDNKDYRITELTPAVKEAGPSKVVADNYKCNAFVSRVWGIGGEIGWAVYTKKGSNKFAQIYGGAKKFPNFSEDGYPVTRENGHWPPIANDLGRGAIPNFTDPVPFSSSTGSSGDIVAWPVEASKIGHSGIAIGKTGVIYASSSQNKLVFRSTVRVFDGRVIVTRSYDKTK